MECAKLVLEYLRVLTSWQVVTAVCILVFFRKFNVPLTSFLMRATDVGGFGFIAKAANPQQTLGTVETTDPKEIVEAAAKQQSQPVAKPPPNTEGIDISALASAVISLASDKNHEYILNEIYGSQWALLHHLLAKQPAGDQLANLMQFYERYRRAMVLQGLPPVNLQAYLWFLYAKELIQDNPPGTIRISEKGVQFLSYALARHPNVFRSF